MLSTGTPAQARVAAFAFQENKNNFKQRRKIPAKW
jgi:hypothetical protein